MPSDRPATQPAHTGPAASSARRASRERNARPSWPRGPFPAAREAAAPERARAEVQQTRTTSAAACVYSRVGASYVGRPICVCAVSAPLRRVQIHISCVEGGGRTWGEPGDPAGGSLHTPVPGRVPARFVGAYHHRQYTVPLCLGVRGPCIAELCSVASRVAS